MADTVVQLLETFPALLFQHEHLRPNRPAMREKDMGIWQVWSWAQVIEQVRDLSCGLAAIGFKRGDNLAIIGDNRPRLYMTMAAVQCLGGVPVPMYQDAIANEMQYVLNDAGVCFAIVEDQEQVDKLLEIKDRCPVLRQIIYDDDRGLNHYKQDCLTSLDEVQRLGRTFREQKPDFLTTEVATGKTDDIAIMLYTSGTTGKPKGVCLSHSALIAAARGCQQFDQLTDREEILSYLPMAWVGDNLFSYAQSLVVGFTINCPESGDTVMTDLREIGPSYYFAPPRIFENLLTQVMIRMEDASAIKQKLFHFFMRVARRCGADVLDGKPVKLIQRLLYSLGNLLIYAPLRNVLGFSRVRIAYTAGAAIGPDLFRFYRSIGINLKQLYGSTETCAYVCLQADRHIKLDSVGIAAPGVELKIADNGEVLVRSPALFQGYYKQKQASSDAINAEGYFHTGDAGFLDNDGQLKIIDRAKDVGKLNNGAMFAPNYIENKLKFFPHIKEAVVFGDQREQVCAFINIDLSAVGNWAERRNLAYSGYVDLAVKPEVLKLIQDCVTQANADLAKDELVADSQIHRFLILHKELDPDDDELTRTRKVRRNFIAEKYTVLIDALYSDKTSQFIETLVRFEDGRTANVAADLQISPANTFATNVQTASQAGEKS